MRIPLSRALLLLSVSLLLVSITFADDNRPVVIKIIEWPDRIYQVQWTVGSSLLSNGNHIILLPDSCRRIEAGTSPNNIVRGNINMQNLYRCEEGIAGKDIGVQQSDLLVPSSILIHYQPRTGESRTVLLTPQQSTWQVPDIETRYLVIKNYITYGIYHIWKGIDHLLFLLCLILIAGSTRRILLTVTGFTIAHSLTLVLSVLDIIQVAVTPTEIVIALSIIFLALEIISGNKNSLTWRYPVTVSSTFGLLHGLGFAAVLKDVGLPQEQVATGLISFNVGVEIGQVLFVLVVALVIRRGSYLLSQWQRAPTGATLQRGFAYSIGITAAFWFFERSAVIFYFL